MQQPESKQKTVDADDGREGPGINVINTCNCISGERRVGMALITRNIESKI
jgi:hypothetical protein